MCDFNGSSPSFIGDRIRFVRTYSLHRNESIGSQGSQVGNIKNLYPCGLELIIVMGAAHNFLMGVGLGQPSFIWV